MLYGRENQSSDGNNLKTSLYLLTYTLYLHIPYLATSSTNLRAGKKRVGLRWPQGEKRKGKGGKNLNHAILSSKCHLRKESGR